MTQERGRFVAEMWCSDVLDLLSDFVDGDLSAQDAQRVTEHLAGCDWCEKFGADFAALVTGLRENLGDAHSLERLRQQLSNKSLNDEDR